MFLSVLFHILLMFSPILSHLLVMIAPVLSAHLSTLTLPFLLLMLPLSLVPISLSFPPVPVAMHIVVWYARIIMIHAPVIGRQINDITGNPFPADVMPRTVISRTPVPISVVRAIPITVIKDDVQVH